MGYPETLFSDNDACMKFNTDFTFDYNPSDGISPGMVDFVGVATHEIGHVLGFVSMVDYNAYHNRVALPPSILDLYRHTGPYGSGLIDISFDGRDAYFSHDGGLTLIDLSDGANSWDGKQASHWADNLGLGIMDPTLGYGELLSITSDDLLAFDVIGWNVVPEPGTMILLSIGLLALAVGRREE
ncbi:PEP-CTERM sorting domain-containing protein [candidate division NPL-UPA2 bacterium]|nr:PEP-CTERM sorting domain-containing protein [candidate division NPL-UPA2 bacterium]